MLMVLGSTATPMVSHRQNSVLPVLPARPLPKAISSTSASTITVLELLMGLILMATNVVAAAVRTHLSQRSSTISMMGITTMLISRYAKTKLLFAGMGKF